MILIDTTVLVDVLRDRSGQKVARLLSECEERDLCTSTFTELELLMGARDVADWDAIHGYLRTIEIVAPNRHSWSGAARIFFDLRRRGLTVRSVVDCCIAQLALENGLTLLHNDRDFHTIARVRGLQHQQFNFEEHQDP